MPTNTYFRLPQEKRQRIYAAAVHEFAVCRYQDVSINRIVKEAQIPRGSFYQYFTDKEDLFYHILDQIAVEKMEIYHKYPLREDCDFFNSILVITPALLEWAKSKPLYYQIGLRLSEEDWMWNDRIYSHFADSQSILMSLLRRDQERGCIRMDVNLELVVQLYLSVSQEIHKAFYRDDTDLHAMYQFLNQFFDILKHGISP